MYLEPLFRPFPALANEELLCSVFRTPGVRIPRYVPGPLSNDSPHLTSVQNYAPALNPKPETLHRDSQLA
jgi:hypothetical protein